MTMEDCYSEMESVAEDASDALQRFIESNRENLELISGTLVSEKITNRDEIEKNLIHQRQIRLLCLFSSKADEYYYTRYQPADINNWSIQLTVPESVAFRQRKRYQRGHPHYGHCGHCHHSAVYCYYILEKPVQEKIRVQIV